MPVSPIPRGLRKQYERTDDAALHDIAAQLATTVLALLDESVDDAAVTEERDSIKRSIRGLNVGDRVGALRLIGTWTRRAERLHGSLFASAR